MVAGIDEIFTPEDEAQFLNEALGKAALYIKGQPQRFAHLVSWHTVNQLLTFSGLGHPRIRLIKENRELEASSYSYVGSNGFPRLLVSELNELLRSGAVLAIDSIEQLHEPASVLCQMIEKMVGVVVELDLYSACQDGPGGAPICDEHENIVLQVDGCKRWRLYRPTGCRAPGRDSYAEPVESPIWEGSLSAGDLLYVPRGWWYSAGPLERPSLYVNVTFRSPTGRDAVVRLFNRLDPLIIQMDLRRFDSFEAQSLVLAHIQKEISERCADAGLVMGLLKDLRRAAEPRICFDLPRGSWSGPVPEEYLAVPLVRFPGPDTIRHLEGDDVEIVHTGRRIVFDGDIVGILEQLSQDHVQSLRTLIEACNGRMPRSRAMEYVIELARHGILALREPREGDCTPGAVLGVA